MGDDIKAQIIKYQRVYKYREVKYMAISTRHSGKYMELYGYIYIVKREQIIRSFLW